MFVRKVNFWDKNIERWNDRKKSKDEMRGKMNFSKFWTKPRDTRIEVPFLGMKYIILVGKVKLVTMIY